MSDTIGLDRIYRVWDQHGYTELRPDADVGSDLWYLERHDIEGKGNKKVGEIVLTDAQIPFLIEALTEIVKRNQK